MLAELTDLIMIRYNCPVRNLKCAESLAPTSLSVNQSWAKQGVEVK